MKKSLLVAIVLLVCVGFMWANTIDDPKQLGSHTVKEGEAIHLTILCADASPEDVLTISVDGLPDGAALTDAISVVCDAEKNLYGVCFTSEVHWPIPKRGVYPLYVSVVDKAGLSDHGVYTLRIENIPPVILECIPVETGYTMVPSF